MLVSKSESATNARKEFFKILDEVANDSSVVIVRRKDSPNVAMIAESELNSLLETVYLLRSPKNAERLFSALNQSLERDLDSFEGDSANREQVMAELRQYCEQEKETDTVEVIAGQAVDEMSDI